MKEFMSKNIGLFIGLALVGILFGAAFLYQARKVSAMPTAALVHAPFHLIQTGWNASNMLVDKYPNPADGDAWYYASGSDKVYMYLGNNLKTQYEFFVAIFETASDTWNSDVTYTWTDTDGESNTVIGAGNLKDTYANTLTGIATAGGKYQIWAYRGI